MKIKLTRDTIVRHKGGEILDVSEEEGRRLIAFGLASLQTDEEKPKKNTKKK